MLATSAEGASGLGPSLVTTGGLIVTAIIGLIGVLFQFRRRNGSGSDDSPQSVIVGLATSLSEEHDERLRLERELEQVNAQLDRTAEDLNACIAREQEREDPPS